MNKSSFDYSGHLIFSPYRIRLKNRQDDISDYIVELIEELPKFAKGTPEDPGEGYSEIPLHSHTRNDEQLPSWMSDEVNEWDCIRYSWEEYTRQNAVVDGDRRPVYIPSVESVDLFFHPSGITLVRGKQSAIHRITSRIQQVAAGELLLDEIDINIAHILSNLRKVDSENEGRLVFKGAQNAEFDAVDEYTDSISFSGGDILSNSIVEEARQSGRVIKIQGRFKFGDFSLLAGLQREKIFVRASYDLSELPSASRMTISILFCWQIIQTQETIPWGES